MKFKDLIATTTPTTPTSSRRATGLPQGKEGGATKARAKGNEVCACNEIATNEDVRYRA
jgi:hypothetical protein